MANKKLIFFPAIGIVLTIVGGVMYANSDTNITDTINNALDEVIVPENNSTDIFDNIDLGKPITIGQYPIAICTSNIQPSKTETVFAVNKMMVVSNCDWNRIGESTIKDVKKMALCANPALDSASKEKIKETLDTIILSKGIEKDVQVFKDCPVSDTLKK